MQTFHDMNLPESLVRSLDYMNFTTPTPIQSQAIPLALAGKDILGSAQTGTGKTGAFAIPIIARLIEKPDTTALVMAPTRELAVQVADNIRKMLGPQPSMTLAVLIGGEQMDKQMRQLRAHPRIIVGTPGRINDHMQRGSVSFERAHFLVLDETDRMLDMGFGIQIEKIIRTMPEERQTMMFSATLPPYITKLSNQYLKNPERISVGEESTAAPKIRQELVQTSISEKYSALTQQLDQREGSIIVFVKTKHGADRLADRLAREDFTAEALHGDLRQSKRDRVVRGFRDKKHRILVATDVAARGLDIPHIEHVINFDLPQCPEDYIHRIGRTGRNGAEGCAVCLLTPEDGGKWKAIHKLMNPPANGDKHEPRDQYGNRSFDNKRKSGGFRDGFKSGGFKSGGPKRDGFKSGRNFDDRPRRDDRYGSSEGRSYSDRPRSNDRYNDRNNERNNDRGYAPRSNERSFDDRPRQPRSFEDRPFGGNRQRDDRPRNDWNNDRPRRDDRPFGGNRSERGGDDFRGNRKQEPRMDYNGNTPARQDRDADGNRRPSGNRDGGFRSDNRSNTGERPFSRPKKSFGNGGGKPFAGKPRRSA